jgi:uncharacterized membrane protein
MRRRIAGCVPAYVGPDAGISAIGTAPACVGAVLLPVVGFVWHPIKRLIKMLRKEQEAGTKETDL